ncbi:sensor histidine kinase [Staphylococcus felis]|uniref:sensor histidine kinase n=1 Tax=Staphylococcus felis TaxID=46127 RepID=UPI003F438C83
MTLRRQLIFSFCLTITITTFLLYTLYKLMWFDGRFTIFLTLCSLLSAMVTLIIGMFLTVPTIKKIEKLNNKTKRIANGQFDNESLNIRTPQEIKQLSESFELMVIKLQEQMNVIKDEQEEKINLVQNLAHDLKTPLASIKSYSEGLKDGVISGDEETQQAYCVLIEQADRLSRMFDELTDVMTVNSQESEQTMIHMDQLLIPIFEAYAHRLQSDARELDVDMAETIQPFLQDKEAIERIIMNLIDNAIKFSKPGTPIDIRVTEDEDEVVSIAITDKGIGIPKSDIQNIFERTFRVENSRHKDTGGSGLGLYIANTLALQIHGRIDVESEIGKGTTMTLYFPANRNVPQTK